MQSNEGGTWLSIVDYSKYRGISISTIRRYIKGNLVKHRMENGKFFIFASNEKLEERSIGSTERELLEMKLENERLKRELIDLKQDLVDLKMLVQTYERNSSTIKSTETLLPEIPAI